MNKKAFRFWNPQARGFVQNYRYRGLVDELFEQDDMLIPSQFIGSLDKNMKEIYEKDVIKFSIYKWSAEETGEVVYSVDSCAYYISDYPIMNLDLESLEIVGNMFEDYMYDETGKLVKQFKS